MFFTTSDDKQVYYEISGNLNSNTALVFLNGLSQNTASWGLLTPHFLNDFKIILIDFVFQGKSSLEGEKRNFDKHANDVIELMNHCNLEKINIAGLSYGSIVAQHLAVNFPSRVDRLVLLSTFAHKTPYYEAIELSWSRSLEIGGYSLMLDVMLPFVLSDSYFNNPIIPIDFLKSMRKDMVEASALHKLMEATLERKDYREELKSVKSKTLIIHGEKDYLFPIELGQAVADVIPNAKFIVLKNVGHTLNLEGTQFVALEIKNHLEN